jgi:hypothetical protein
MIYTKELMIGNIIKGGVVTHIKPNLILLNMTKPVRPVNANPVQITPEILKNCGFKKLVNTDVSYGAYWNILYKRNITESTTLELFSQDAVEYRWIEGNTKVSLYYLHQLQNLYYSLTGEELEVEL